MNERLRDLVRQAGLDDSDFPIEDWDNVPLAKFAELIVKECLDQLLIGDQDEDYDKGIYWSREQIKQHFGVKE